MKTTKFFHAVRSTVKANIATNATNLKAMPALR